MTACILLAWLKLLALDGDPAPSEKEGTPRGRGTPGRPARQPGHRHTPALETRTGNPPDDYPAAAISSRETSGLVVVR